MNVPEPADILEIFEQPSQPIQRMPLTIEEMIAEEDRKLRHGLRTLPVAEPPKPRVRPIPFDITKPPTRGGRRLDPVRLKRGSR